MTQLRSDPEPEWDLRTVEVLGMLPNYYLQYFYHTDRKLKEQQSWPPSRGEEVIEIEKDLLKQYADPSLSEPPADLMLRGGAFYSTVATQLLNAHYNDLGETHVVNTAHPGQSKGWPEDWVLEMPCRVDKSGIHPLPAEPLPPVCFGLLAQVKSYELLTVEAAVHGDRDAAFQALLAHPLGPPADCIQTVLDDMLVTNRIYLPQFWKHWKTPAKWVRRCDHNAQQSQLLGEIYEQPEAIRRMLENEAERVAVDQPAALAAQFLLCPGGGRGTSDNAARYGQYILGAINRLSVALAAPSLFTRYHTPPRLQGALVIGISQSGQSPDIVSVIEEGRRQGAPTIAITNDLE